MSAFLANFRSDSFHVICVAYIVANFLLALIVLGKSHRNQISQFYFFCVACLVTLGFIILSLWWPMGHSTRNVLQHAVIFIYSLLPFFFIHFMTFFLRRMEVAQSKYTTIAIYSAGLLAYAMVLASPIPRPVAPGGEITLGGKTYFIIWMSIFFTIGVAMLFEISRRFKEKLRNANLLFVSFTLLMLILPGPFTESLFSVFGIDTTTYYYISTSALLFIVYFIFRHKILSFTIYDAFKTAIPVMTDMLMVMDEDCQIEMIRGKAMTNVLGYTDKELIGKGLKEILVANDQLQNCRDRAFKGEAKETYFDADVIAKSGSKFPMNFSLAPLLVDGRVGGFVSVARDITERKRLEEELRQAQKMESLGTLAGGIAHDFNNILQIILVNTSSLKRKMPDAEKLAQVVDINTKAVQRGASLVQQVLTFARKTDAQFKPLKLNTLVEDLRKMLGETFPKTITFSLELDASLPSIDADQNQVHQVLMNLCVNARDAMPKGGTISIRTEAVPGWDMRKKYSEAQESKYACLTVTDTGMGMPEDVRQRIFEPFFTTKEQGKGTGLGLSVVYGIIKAHKGFIDVMSTVGIGTTFTVYFPAGAEGRGADAEQTEGQEADMKGAETILVVEDEDVLLQSMELLLKSKGYAVVSAKDGIEAIDVFKKHKSAVRLVILDIGLPKLSGWEALDKMKEINPRLKCIISSGYLDPIQKSGKHGLGPENFIIKPYEPSDILRTVRKVLDTHPT